jgi:spermidine/putrescine transport system ATP-binding protein
MAEPIIRFEAVSKRFGKVTAVDQVSLAIDEGEFFALLGPSGCGKTTLLRMIAGFETPTEGRILIDGQDVSTTPPNRRPVNMVFQSYAVFPHMSVADNVAYGLKVENVPARERNARVGEALALVKLEGFEARKPDQLSGGQRQRVALARALIKRPRVLLLDEPLSALDAKLREAMRFELAQLQQKIGVTFVFVTHDQEEALAMASRCAVMNRGLIQQVAAPADLYEFPASRFVADFIGQVNLFEGALTGDEADEALIECPGLSTRFWVDHGVSGATSATVWVALRPEKIVLSEGPLPAGPGPEGANRLQGVVRHAAYLGGSTVYEIEIEGGRMIKVERANASRREAEAFAPGLAVWLSWSGDAAAVLLS